MEYGPTFKTASSLDGHVKFIDNHHQPRWPPPFPSAGNYGKLTLLRINSR
jgi:hypothetical protein